VEPSGINCASVVLYCADIIFNYTGPILRYKGLVLGAQPPLHCEFRGENGLDQLGFNCAAIIFDRTHLISQILGKQTSIIDLKPTYYKKMSKSGKGDEYDRK